jgi:putative transposase
VVAVDVPHHLTQRGNNRQVVYPADADKQLYLDLLRKHARLQGIRLLGFCLMSNHVHLVAIPDQAGSFARGLGRAHGDYSIAFNRAYGRSGHLWQNRFYSSPLARDHLGLALRYVDLNLVRAGLVERAEQWLWSSAQAHAAGNDPSGLLDQELWRQLSPLGDWAEVLRGAEESPERIERLRSATRSGRPFGDEEFAAELERRLGRRRLAAGPGRPPKQKAAQGGK